MYCYRLRFKVSRFMIGNLSTFCFAQILLKYFFSASNKTIQMELFTNVKSTSILNPLEGNNALFTTGYKGLLTNEDLGAARDFYYLLLMVYVNCCCILVLSHVLNSLCGYGRDIQHKLNERDDFVHMTIDFSVEDKEYVLQLSFSQKERVEFSFILRNLYRKTVLQ